MAASCERRRADRVIGMAQDQADRVHQGVDYDVVVDTTDMAAVVDTTDMASAACAATIVERLAGPRPP